MVSKKPVLLQNQQLCASLPHPLWGSDAYLHLLWDNWVSHVSSSCRIWLKRMLSAKLYRTLEMEINILKCIHKLTESSCRGFSKICSWQCVLYNLTGRFQINCEFQLFFKAAPALNIALVQMSGDDTSYSRYVFLLQIGAVDLPKRKTWNKCWPSYSLYLPSKQ